MDINEARHLEEGTVIAAKDADGDTVDIIKLEEGLWSENSYHCVDCVITWNQEGSTSKQYITDGFIEDKFVSFEIVSEPVAPNGAAAFLRLWLRQMPEDWEWAEIRLTASMLATFQIGKQNLEKAVEDEIKKRPDISLEIGQNMFKESVILTFARIPKELIK